MFSIPVYQRNYDWKIQRSMNIGGIIKKAEEITTHKNTLSSKNHI